MLAQDRIVAIVTPDAAPSKRLVAEAKEHGTLIDATCGRRTKSIVITDSGHIVLSFMDSERLAAAKETAEVKR